jgi:DNA polymerase I-like protein with 3'-5' exonuclease and polymerase domains
MSIKNAKPSETYEGLKIQFSALKRLLQSKEVEVEHYRKKIKEFRLERIIELESELESEKEMNAILTKELELTTSARMTQNECYAVGILSNE